MKKPYGSLPRASRAESVRDRIDAVRDSVVDGIETQIDDLECDKRRLETAYDDTDADEDALTALHDVLRRTGSWDSSIRSELDAIAELLNSQDNRAARNLAKALRNASEAIGAQFLDEARWAARTACDLELVGLAAYDPDAARSLGLVAALSSDAHRYGLALETLQSAVAAIPKPVDELTIKMPEITGVVPRMNPL